MTPASRVARRYVAREKKRLQVAAEIAAAMDRFAEQRGDNPRPTKISEDGRELAVSFWGNYDEDHDGLPDYTDLVPPAQRALSRWKFAIKTIDMKCQVGGRRDLCTLYVTQK